MTGLNIGKEYGRTTPGDFPPGAWSEMIKRERERERERERRGRGQGGAVNQFEFEWINWRPSCGTKCPIQCESERALYDSLRPLVVTNWSRQKEGPRFLQISFS